MDNFITIAAIWYSSWQSRARNKLLPQDHTRCTVKSIVKITTKCCITWWGWETGDVILFRENMKKSSEILHSSLLEKFSIRFSLPRTLIFYQKPFLNFAPCMVLVPCGQSVSFCFDFSMLFFVFLPLVGQCSAVGSPDPLPEFACLVITYRLQVLQARIMRGIATNGEQMSWIMKKMECYPDAGNLLL